MYLSFQIPLQQTSGISQEQGGWALHEIRLMAKVGKVEKPLLLQDDLHSRVMCFTAFEIISVHLGNQHGVEPTRSHTLGLLPGANYSALSPPWLRCRSCGTGTRMELRPRGASLYLSKQACGPKTMAAKTKGGNLRTACFLERKLVESSASPLEVIEKCLNETGLELSQARHKQHSCQADTGLRGEQMH